jgi:uncharacterized protein (DUF2252 family)
VAKVADEAAGEATPTPRKAAPRKSAPRKTAPRKTAVKAAIPTPAVTITQPAAKSASTTRRPAKKPTAPASPAGFFRGEQDSEAVRRRGRAARRAVKRQVLGDWTPPVDRPDPIELIEATNVDRMPALIPLRWTRMLESPFAYLRGAASVMAADLAGSPTSGLQAQICGDAHVANFGLFASPERQQVLDVNDFDESLPGPWEFDVKRLSASIVVAGRVAGIKDKACRTAVSGAVHVYREVVHALAGLPVLTAWSSSLDGELSRLIGLDELNPVLKAVYGKARKKSSLRAAKRMASKQADSGWRFDDEPPELTRLPEDEAGVVLESLDGYAATLPVARQVLLSRYRPVDVALRVGGLGSIGLRTYAVLLHGSSEDDPLVLQVKESRVPAISRWIGTAEPDRHQGERTVAAQQLMQTASDPMLGWTRIEGRDYLVRQFRDMKGSVDATRLEKNQIDDYGRLVGALLARAHCRSLDPRLLAGYLGNSEQLDDAMVAFAFAYADQTAQDHAALVEAAEQGRVPTI